MAGVEGVIDMDTCGAGTPSTPRAREDMTVCRATLNMVERSDACLPSLPWLLDLYASRLSVALYVYGGQKAVCGTIAGACGRVRNAPRIQ